MNPSEPNKADIYPPTQWSQVFAAANSDTMIRQRALSLLYQTYSQPVYCCVRRRGYDHLDAEDLTQGFFYSLILGSKVSNADPAKGRFRAFIQQYLEYFINNEWRKVNCDKRKPEGGFLSLDQLKTTHWYEPADGAGLTPEALLDREWAKSTLAASIALTKSRYKTPEQLAVFEALSPLMDKPHLGMYAEIAERLQMTENTLRVAKLRLQKRFAEDISKTVAETLENPTPKEIRDEILYLFSLLV